MPDNKYLAQFWRDSSLWPHLVRETVNRRVKRRWIDYSKKGLAGDLYKFLKEKG